MSKKRFLDNISILIIQQNCLSPKATDCQGYIDPSPEKSIHKRRGRNPLMLFSIELKIAWLTKLSSHLRDKVSSLAIMLISSIDIMGQRDIAVK